MRAAARMASTDGLRSTTFGLATALALGGAAGAAAVALDLKIFGVIALLSVFVLVLWYVWLDPRLGLYAAVLTFSLDALGRLPLTEQYPVTLYQITMAVTLLSAFRAQRAGKLTLKWKRTPMDLPLLLFVALALVTVGFAPNLRAGMITFGSLISSVTLFYLIIVMIDTPEESRRLLLWFLGVALVLAVLALLERLLGVSIAGAAIKTTATGIRVRGSFKDPNMFGMMMMMAIVAGVPLVMEEQKRIQRLMLLGGVVILAALGLTFSRGAWVAGIIAIVAVVLAYPGSRRTRIFPLTLCVALCVLIAFQLLPRAFVQKRIYGVFGDRSALSRVYMARAGVDIVRENPVGVGLAGFPFAYPRFRIGGALPGLVNSHIAYLTVIVELGIPGLALFLWVLWRLWSSVWPAVRDGRRGLAARVQLAAGAAVLGLLVQALTYSIELSKQLWFVMGLTMAAHLVLTPDTHSDEEADC